MKKIILPTLIGLSVATAAYAAVELAVSPFLVRFTVNQQEVMLPEAYTVLNQEGSTYVPLRFVAEAMEGQVSYNEEERRISIAYASDREMKMTHAAEAHQGDVQLTLRSAWQTYRSSEQMVIQSEVLYTGDRPLKIKHGNPLVVYTIRDEDGKSLSTGVQQALITDELSPNTTFTSRLPLALLSEFNSYRSADAWKLEMLQKDRPWLLPAGRYVIEATAAFTVNDERKMLKCELAIEVGG
ncbi:stalk domain-containing protein [Paenibacillus whitsoniae]|uniref:Copper amine oxidase N-terminal domain-containing protein n=1 Tax=Paenibacillus whitsoniae TaxID=2496558 RepID=A0A3S0A1I4_9BACL|nr:stalk domain-containing protein [Paenibacillus whitsoniae]RTE06465.1 copper amine oxidase N-terminal domain-containing protein [Paenibacillus whitsoniae]